MTPNPAIHYTELPLAAKAMNTPNNLPDEALPELPEPNEHMQGRDLGGGNYQEGFTADQMQAYARAAIAAERENGAGDRKDAERWRLFVACTVGKQECPAIRGVDMNLTPSGYNGGKWATAELAWEHPAWSEHTANHMNAAIDSLRDAAMSTTGGKEDKA